MTYAAELVIPIESGFPNLKTDQFSVEENNRLLLTSLELVEERREVAVVKMEMTHYQQRLKQGYDKRVKLRPLASEDLVLRKVVGTARNPAWGKLGPNWKRPILNNINGWCRGLLLGRLRQECDSMSLECK